MNFSISLQLTRTSRRKNRAWRDCAAALTAWSSSVDERTGANVIAWAPLGCAGVRAPAFTAARGKHSKRTQWIRRTRSETDQQHRGPDGERGAEAAPEPAPHRTAAAPDAKQPERCRRDQQPQRGQQHLRDRPEHRPHDPQRRRQQHDAEKHLHAVHPGAGTRQQRAGTQSDDQQRHAEPHAHRKQRGAAEHRVARMRDERQHGEERRGHAGADHERRQARPSRRPPRTCRPSVSATPR